MGMSRLIRLGLAVSLVLMAACSDGGSFTCSCPASLMQPTLLVMSASGAITGGVQATLEGRITETMSCEPNVDGTSVLCTWSGSVADGTYSLQVTADGYQSVTATATVTISDGGSGSCACSSARMSPSQVTLKP